jgi:hypothetical protein
MNNNIETKTDQIISNENQKQKKQSLKHSEMMESLLSTFSKTNRNIIAVKEQEKGNINENIIEVVFLKKLPGNI